MVSGSSVSARPPGSKGFFFWFLMQWTLKRLLVHHEAQIKQINGHGIISRFSIESVKKVFSSQCFHQTCKVKGFEDLSSMDSCQTDPAVMRSAGGLT